MRNLLQPNNNQEVPSLDDLQDFIRRWNYLYPVDRWWRQKYNVPINSKQHKRANIVDMRLDYEEDRLYTQERIKALTKEAEPEYIPGRGDWLTSQKNEELSKEQTDDIYDSIDIDKIDEDGEGGTIII